MTTRIPADDLRDAIKQAGLPIEIVATGTGWDVILVQPNGRTLLRKLSYLDLVSTDLAEVATAIRQDYEAEIRYGPQGTDFAVFDRVQLTNEIWQGMGGGREVRTGTVVEIVTVGGQQQYQVLHDNKTTAKWPRSALRHLGLAADPQNPAMPLPPSKPPPEPELKPLTTEDRFAEGDEAFRIRRKAKAKAKTETKAGNAKFLINGVEVGVAVDVEIGPANLTDPSTEKPLVDLIMRFQHDVAGLLGRKAIKKIVVDRDTHRVLTAAVSPTERYTPVSEGQLKVLAVGDVIMVPDVG